MDIVYETNDNNNENVNDNGMDTNTNYNDMNTNTNDNNIFFLNSHSVIPITEEFAPEYPYKILDNLINVINTPGIEFNNVINFVKDQDWKGIYQLYNNNNNDSNGGAESFANNINISLVNISKQYNSRYEIIINENSRHKSSKLTNLFIDKTKYLIDYITKQVEKNIDKEKIRREKLSVINFLKGEIDKIYRTNPESLYLYDLTINQYDITNKALEKKMDIQLKYTELGVILMLKTELLHDLSPPVLDKETTGNLQNDLNKLISANSPFRALLDKEDGKPITYTEEISTELILYISSLKGINRIYRQNDVDSVTRGEKKLGSTILPSIFNNNNISITSDADNTAALIYSQISKNMKLENNTSKIYPFLGLDAGSGPSLHGFIESFVRQAQLEILSRASDNDNDDNDENNDDSTTILNIASVKITIKDPSNRIMLTMENNNILNNPNYTINCTGFDTFKLNELSITNVAEKINNPPYLSSINSQKSRKKNINDQPSVLNIAIIKSIGDLIPYQVVSFFRALNPRSNENLNELLNIVSSRDYSMIFQIISNVQYFINGLNNTNNLNDKKIIVGCNLSNANAFFPFSERMNKIFNYMSIIVNDQNYINLKNDIIKNAAACFFCPINGSINFSSKSNSNNPAIQNISANLSSFLDVNDCYIKNIDNDQFILLNERYKNFLYNNDLCNFDELINNIERDNNINKNFNIDCLKKLNDKINKGVKNLYDIFENYNPIEEDNNDDNDEYTIDNNEYIIDNIDYCIAIKLYDLDNDQKAPSNMDNNQKASSTMDMETSSGGTRKNKRKQPKKYKSYNRKNKTKSNRNSKSKKHNKSKNKRKSNKTLRKHK